VTIPIYKGFQLPENCHNRALFFEKCCDGWDATWSFDKQKSNWLTKLSMQPAGNAKHLENALHRYSSLVESLGGKLLFVRTQGRFVTGIGNEHPVENGFSWHPTLATPYLPGSSLKGLLRSWYDFVNLEDTQEIFGNDSLGNTGQVGKVIFFDAIPRKPIKLKPDVMTPHYSEYYSQNSIPPGDWQQPVPIPFLTVDENQAFVFAIAPRRKEDSKYLDQVYEKLIQVLSYLGAGAKTAVGYGRFTEDVQASKEYEKQKIATEKERKKQEKIARMSPIQREMLTDGYDEEGFINKIESWLQRAEQADKQEGIEIAKTLRSWYNTHRKGTFDKPNKKNKDRVRRIKEILS